MGGHSSSNATGASVIPPASIWNPTTISTLVPKLPDLTTAVPIASASTPITAKPTPAGSTPPASRVDMMKTTPPKPSTSPKTLSGPTVSRNATAAITAIRSGRELAMMAASPAGIVVIATK